MGVMAAASAMAALSVAEYLGAGDGANPAVNRRYM